MNWTKRPGIGGTLFVPPSVRAQDTKGLLKTYDPKRALKGCWAAGLMVAAGLASPISVDDKSIALKPSTMLVLSPRGLYIS
jgi:hypothetical protein